MKALKFKNIIVYLSLLTFSCSNKNKFDLNFYNGLNEMLTYDGYDSFLTIYSFKDEKRISYYFGTENLLLRFSFVDGIRSEYIRSRKIERSGFSYEFRIDRSILNENYKDIENGNGYFNAEFDGILMIVHPITYLSGYHFMDNLSFSPLYILPILNDNFYFELTESYIDESYLKKINYYKFKQDLKNYNSIQEFLNFYQGFYEKD
ncbi:MAG: hypothetical protein IJ656_03060 [Bacilli bacterium]|nr:hypothetical protein [Bacilli bacterium]MBR1581991.1 hypothetical protein [Bacilli bacterium]